MTGPRVDSSTGIRGVFPSGKIKKPWRAAISKNGKYVHVGHYETREEARGRAYAQPQVMDELPGSARGTGGFGSTDRKES